MLPKRFHSPFSGRMVMGILLLFLFSGCQVIQSRKIERINRIPEKNAMKEEILIAKGMLIQQQQSDKDYQNAVKEHKRKQSDATLAHMKYLKKRSAFVNRHKKRSFCERLFNPSCR